MNPFVRLKINAIRTLLLSKGIVSIGITIVAIPNQTIEAKNLLCSIGCSHSSLQSKYKAGLKILHQVTNAPDIANIV